MTLQLCAEPTVEQCIHHVDGVRCEREGTVAAAQDAPGGTLTVYWNPDKAPATRWVYCPEHAAATLVALVSIHTPRSGS